MATVCMSVCPSVRIRADLSNGDRVLFICVHISLIVEYLFYKYFVRRSVGQAKKGRNVKI